MTDSVPGRRHGDPESSSVLVNRPLSSLTTSNVPRSLYTPPPINYPSTHRRWSSSVHRSSSSFARPPLRYIYILYTVVCRTSAASTPPPPPPPPPSLLFAADGNRIFPPQNKPGSLSVHIRAPTHTHTHSQFDCVYVHSVYAQRLGRGGCRYSREYTRTTRTHARERPTRFFSSFIHTHTHTTLIRRRRFCVSY